MKSGAIAIATLIAFTIPSKATELTEIAQFAESICADIPQGNLTRTEIAGKVGANAGAFAKIVGGSANIDAKRTAEIYKGIPFDKLPDKIPTVGMCKSHLAEILLESRKGSNNIRSESYSVNAPKGVGVGKNNGSINIGNIDK
ncbi:hypothetical protein [Methylobacterium fujisawaense]|uniref:hypothetical protein n=1 Tax=Methylobacterium fujisawaense TaxID=107400 RepID=UPI0036F84CC6